MHCSSPQSKHARQSVTRAGDSLSVRLELVCEGRLGISQVAAPFRKEIAGKAVARRALDR